MNPAAMKHLQSMRLRLKPALPVFAPMRLLALLFCLPLVLALPACQRTDAQEQPHSQAPDSDYVAVARGRIDVEGGPLQLTAPVAGMLAAVHVRAGDAVQAGQKLASLDAQAAQLAVDEAQAALAAAQAQLDLDDVEIQAAQAQARRLTKAQAAGVGDGQAAEQAQTKAARLQAQRKIHVANASRAQARLEQARHVLRQQDLTAPVAATVLEVHAHAGAATTPDRVLFKLLPEGPRIVRAELNESYADAVEPGMQARIETHDGQQSWPGRVLRVGQVYGPSILSDDPVRQANTRAVESVLELQTEQPPRVGKRVWVRILPNNEEK